MTTSFLPRRIPDQATAEGEIGIGAHRRGERVQKRPPVGVDGRQVGGTELDAERIVGEVENGDQIMRQQLKLLPPDQAKAIEITGARPHRRTDLVHQSLCFRPVGHFAFELGTTRQQIGIKRREVFQSSRPSVRKLRLERTRQGMLEPPYACTAG